MSQQSAEQTSEFFQQWAIYRDVIKHNYMHHNELGVVLDRHLNAYTSLIDVLDLGCGDAELFVRSQYTDKVKHYTGVDMSNDALALAKEHLQAKPFDKSFIVGDFYQYAMKKPATYDLIVVGYTLHHLSREQKETFLEHVKEMLKPSGKIVVYDLVRKNKETRDEFIDRICLSFDQSWCEFNDEQLAGIHDHVRNNDQPETEQFFENQAKNLGIKYSTDYRDDKAFYAFMTYQI